MAEEEAWEAAVKEAEEAEEAAEEAAKEAEEAGEAEEAAEAVGWAAMEVRCSWRSRTPQYW